LYLALCEVVADRDRFLRCCQFPMDVKKATLVMKVVIEQGGLAPGGLNFDAKVSTILDGRRSRWCEPACHDQPLTKVWRQHMSHVSHAYITVSSKRSLRIVWRWLLLQVRRESTDVEDMFIAHIGAMDTFAR
jgi:hypothetical protein